ncbi:transposase, partial [uncultured Succinivibrio sp.]
SAVTLHAVLGNPDDFPNSRHFASFAGFAPRVSGSEIRNFVFRNKHDIL